MFAICIECENLKVVHVCKSWITCKNNYIKKELLIESNLGLWHPLLKLTLSAN